MKKIHNSLLKNSKYYFEWHNSPKSDKAHWTILFLVAAVFVLMVFSSFTSYLKMSNSMMASAISAKNNFVPPGLVDKDDLENITRPPALGLGEYNIELLNLVTDLKESPAENKSASAKRISEYAKMRKDTVLRKMKEDPEAVLRGALPESALRNIPDEALSNIEKRRKVSGKFEYVHIHYGDFDQGTTVEEFYVVESGTNKRYQVLMKGEPKSLTDDLVSIDGAVLDDYIATTDENIQINSSANRQASAAQDNKFLARIQRVLGINKLEAQAVNQRKTAVIMFNWQNDTRTTLTESSARSAVFTAANSANSYFKENSFNKIELVGKLGLDGDVFGWVTIPYDNVNCSSMYNTWAAAADNILKSQGKDMTGYNIRTYIFPSVSCGWSGLAYVGGTNTTSFINSASISVITHEIGHNLGSRHAGALNCTENGVRVPISADANCVLSEYGDPYSVMGSASGMKHFNNFHKGTTLNALNWLNSSNTLTLDRSKTQEGTYSIEPIEKASTGIQSLRIPRTISSTGTVSDYYYLEFRQPIGFDKGISTAVSNGVSIRVAPNYNLSDKSKLIDTTPETTSFADAPLLVGKTFTDQSKSISVTTLSVSTTSVEVKVGFGDLPCTRANPTLTISPTTASIYAGQAAQVTYSLKNNDSYGCSASSYSINMVLPTGILQAIPSSITHNISAGSTVSGTILVQSDASATVGVKTVGINTVNTSSTGGGASQSFNVTILAPDTTAPSITIGNPKDGTTISKGKVGISVSASDASGIGQISIYVNGANIKSCYNVTSCSANVNSGSLSAGSHTISATAWDKVGPVANTASASVTVLKK